jgi:hypothetical protein
MRMGKPNLRKSRHLGAMPRPTTYEIAEVHAYRHEGADALEWLEGAYVQKDGTLKWITVRMRFCAPLP